jgi:hypothetical protein
LSIKLISKFKLLIIKAYYIRKESQKSSFQVKSPNLSADVEGSEVKYGYPLRAGFVMAGTHKSGMRSAGGIALTIVEPGCSREEFLSANCSITAAQSRLPALDHTH